MAYIYITSPQTPCWWGLRESGYDFCGNPIRLLRTILGGRLRLLRTGYDFCGNPQERRQGEGSAEAERSFTGGWWGLPRP